MTNQEANAGQAESPQEAFNCLELAKIFEERDDVGAADRWRARARPWAMAFSNGAVDAGQLFQQSPGGANYVK